MASQSILLKVLVYSILLYVFITSQLSAAFLKLLTNVLKQFMEFGKI